MDSQELRKKYHWAQDTPAMQLAVIYQSLYGWFSNYFVYLCSTRENTMKYMGHNFEELEALLPFIKQGHW